MGHTPSDRCPETCPDSKFLGVVHSDFVRRREHDQVRPLENEEEEKRRRAADRFWEERRILIIADCERHSFSTDVVLRRLDRDRKWQERGEMLRGRSKGTNELEERAHTMLVKAAHECEIANLHPSRWPSMFEGDPVLLTVSRDEADARAKEAKQRLDDLAATLTSLGIDFGI